MACSISEDGSLSPRSTSERYCTDTPALSATSLSRSPRAARSRWSSSPTISRHRRSGAGGASGCCTGNRTTSPMPSNVATSRVPWHRVLLTAERWPTRQSGTVSVPLTVPIEWLSTARLSLRPPTPADGPAVLRILSDRSVVEHNPSDLVEELSEVEALLERWLVHWSEHGFGNSCVVEKATGRLIGNCGVRRTTVRGAPV